MQELTDEQVELIAERAAEKAMAKLAGHIYQEVGKSVVSKLFYVVGTCAVGLYLWLSSKKLI